ncbi:lyase family protein [Oryzibacter oryziterrae]|uniref:lyase family protein n=1 Tax=Oryzibacter oryziterrae TaxID=2766474 RepID=UPI001EFF5C41|nr:lyase family protein [Oryzibacter oryziterrae]
MTSPARYSLYGALLVDPETADAFSGEAEIATMLKVEAALARVQARHGVIPAKAAEAIGALIGRVRIAPEEIAAGAARDGVPVPALVAALRQAADDPETSSWLHWGATSQDIMDTALALRLRDVIALWRARLDRVIDGLADLAERHADLAMTGRTYGQAATPTSFGALVASWGRPLLRHRQRLDALTPDLLRVSLSGAAGTLSVLGSAGPGIRAALAAELGLGDPGASWHAERDGIAAFGQWMGGLTASLAKMGEDLLALTQSDTAEIRLAGAGGSSTMPQKQNPVAPSVLVALARHVQALSGEMTGAVVHRLQRDGSAWFSEWLALPDAAIATGRSLTLALDLVPAIQPDAEAMARHLAGGGGVLYAEALTFALAERMPRPDAARRVAALCRKALAGEGDLLALAEAEFPGEGWQARLTGPATLGLAPAEARAFSLQVQRERPAQS